jgi:steroid delta-isomerase-like uncharacterized protein
VSEETNKIAVLRFFDEVWNHGEVARVNDFLAAGFVLHNTMGVSVMGPDEYGQGVIAYRSAFPDLTTTIDDIVAEGDRVAVRGTDRGTHQGPYMGRPASGREVTVTWIEIFRIENGLTVEGWLEFDAKRLLDQLDDPSAVAGM